MNTRFFSLLLSLFCCASFAAQGSTQTMSRPTHFAGGSSSSGSLLREPKIQKIDLIENSDGGFLIDFSALRLQSPLVELQAKGEHIGTISIVNGSVQFENQTEHDFTFRGIPPLDGMKVISKGNITFEEEVLCKEGGVFDVAGRCHFQKGIRFEDSDAKVFLSRGTFDFDGASVVPQVHLVNHPTVSVRKGALLENELMVSLEKGEQKPTLKNAGRFVSKTVYGQFDKILTAAGSLTDIQQAHVVCSKAINRGDLSIAKGYLETESFTNLKNMQVGDLELCSLETINRGLFKARILKSTQGNFHNTKTATLDVFEKFTGNFNDFKDDGKSLFHGLANISAKDARLSNHTQGYALSLHASDSLFVSQDATFDIQHHMTLFSEKDQDLEGDVQVTFNPELDHSFDGFQESTRHQLTGMTSGAFFSAQRDLRHRGQVRSSNSTLFFQAGETFSDKDAKTQSGYFKDNTLRVTAKHAELTGEARSFDGMVVQAESALLRGKRQADKTIQLQIKDGLTQLEGDLTKGKKITALASSMDLAGYIDSAKQTYLETGEELRVQESARMMGGPAFLKGEDVVLGGQFTDIASVVAEGEKSVTLESTGKNKSDGSLVLKSKHVHVDAPVSTKTGAFVANAEGGIVSFGANADVRPESSHVSGDYITHQRGSTLVARGTNVETAQKDLVTEGGSHIGAETNVLTSKESKIDLGGKVKSSKNTFTDSKGQTIVRGTGDVESGDTTVAKAGGDFLSFGDMRAKHHSIRTDGIFLNAFGGSIKSEESFTVDAAVYANLFGGSITARSARVNADWLSLSCLSNLSARDVEINSLINANLGARINGGRSYTVNAGMNLSLFGLNQSMNYTSNAALNITELSFLTGLPSFYALPSFDDRKDWWDSEKSFYEQGLFTYGLKTGLSMVGGVAGGSIGKAVAGIQTAMGAGSLVTSLPDLVRFDDVPEEDKWRPSHLVKKFGQGLGAYRSAQRLYQGATELLTPTQGPQPQPKPFWTRVKDTAASTFGPQATVNSLWNYEGSATGGWNWNFTGQFTRNTSYNSNYGTTCAFTNTTNAAWGQDHSTVYALRDTSRISGDYTLGGKKRVLWDLSAHTGGNLTLDGDLDAYAGRGIDFTVEGDFFSEVGSSVASRGKTKAIVTGKADVFGSMGGDEGVHVQTESDGITLHETAKVSSKGGNASVQSAKGLVTKDGSLVEGGKSTSLIAVGLVDHGGQAISHGSELLPVVERSSQKSAEKSDETLEKTIGVSGDFSPESKSTSDLKGAPEKKAPPRRGYEGTVIASSEDGVILRGTSVVDATGGDASVHSAKNLVTEKGSVVKGGKNTFLGATGLLDLSGYVISHGSELLPIVEESSQEGEKKATPRRGYEGTVIASSEDSVILRDTSVVDATGGDASVHSAKNIVTEKGSDVKALQKTHLMAQKDVTHGGSLDGTREGFDVVSFENDITLKTDSKAHAGEGAGLFQAEKGKFIGQDFSVVRGNKELYFIASDIQTSTRVIGEYNDVFYKARNSLVFDDRAYNWRIGHLSLISGQTPVISPSAHFEAESLMIDAPNVANIPQLFEQTGAYSNFHIHGSVRVDTTGYVVFPTSLTSASQSFALNTDSITVTNGVDIYAPEMLSLYANDGNFTLGHGARVRSGVFTDIYASGDVIGHHNLTTWDWTSKHTKGNVQGATFSAAAFQGGTGVDYLYKDPVTGEESVIQLGLRVKADGKVRGTGMTFDAPGSVMVDGALGVENEGLSVEYLKDYTSKDRATNTKRSYTYDTFFFTGGVKSSGGKVLLYSAEGDFMQRSGFLSAAQGITAHVHGDIYTPELFGTKGYKSRRSGNAVQNLFRPFWSKDRTNKDGLSESISETVLSGPIHHISDTGDVIMPGRVLVAPQSTEYLHGKRFVFEATPLHHSRKAKGFEWGFNVNLGKRPLGFFKDIGKGLSLMARPWKLHDIYRRDGLGAALKAGPLAAIGGDLTLYSDLKHVASTFAEKGLKEGLKELSPSVGVTLDYVTQRRGWDTTGSGYTLVGNAVHLGDELHLGGGYTYKILGDLHSDVANVYLTGQRLGFYDREFRVGEGITLGASGPKFDVHTSYDGTKGHAYTPSTLSVGGTFTGNIGHLHQDAGIMKIYDAQAGSIGQVTSRSRQFVSNRKFGNASVAYNPITQEVSVSLGGTPDRIRTRLDSTDPSGVFIENAGAGFSIGKEGGIDLTGAKLEITTDTGDQIGPITKHDLPEELNGEGVSIAVSVSSSKSTENAPSNDVLSGTLGATYHHDGNSYGVTVPVTFSSPSSSPSTGGDVKTLTDKTSFWTGVWGATKNVRFDVSHGGRHYTATPNSVVEFCDRDSWRQFGQDMQTIGRNTYDHFFPTPPTPIYVPTPEPVSALWAQDMLAGVEDRVHGKLLEGLSLTSECPDDMRFDLSGPGGEDIALISGGSYSVDKISPSAPSMNLGNEFFEGVRDDPIYDPFSPLNLQNYSPFASHYQYDFANDPVLNTPSHHGHNFFMHALHEGLLIEGGIHMPHYFQGHPLHPRPHTVSNNRLWNRSFRLFRGAIMGGYGETIPLYTASKPGVLAASFQTSYLPAIRPHTASAVDLFSLETLYEPLTYMHNGHAYTFSHRVTGTGVYLEEPFLTSRVRSALLDMKLSSSPRIQRGYNALHNPETATLVFADSTLPWGNVGQVGSHGPYKGLGVHGVKGSQYLNGDTILIAGGSQTSPSPVDPKYTLPHEGTHLANTHQTGGYFNPAHVLGDAAATLDRSNYLLRCYAADAHNLGYRSLSSVPNSAIGPETRMLFEGSWEYFKDSFKTNLIKEGIFLPESHVSVILKDVEKGLLNGQSPSARFFKSNPVTDGVGRSLLAAENTMCSEISAIHAEYLLVDPHSTLCPNTNSALEFLEGSLEGAGTTPTSSWWDRLKVSPKLQTPVRWGKTAWNTTKTAAPFALPAVDWGLHVYSEYQDGYDIHDALGRGNVRFVTDNVVYGGIYGGIGLYAGFWPTLAIGGLSFAAEFVPEYSQLDLHRGHNSMAQAVQNQDPMAFWNALQTTRHMHGNKAFKDIFTAPRVCATWAFDQVQTHAPEITKTLSLMSRYNAARDLNNANAEQLRALQRINWVRNLFGKKPYDTSHLHVEDPMQLLERVEREQRIEDYRHTLLRARQEEDRALQDELDGCNLRALPRVQLSREQQEALDDMFDIYGGL